jgi:inosine/xanthosine triphosphatase
MRTVYVAVGTTRRPKINAVWEALTIFGPLIDAEARFQVVSEEVESGVAGTPVSREELMRGARRRAEAMAELARRRQALWQFFVGLEGGLEVLEEGGARRVFLESWAYVMDTSGRSAYGRSGAILVPEALAARVLDQGAELEAAIDEFAGAQGIRDQQGAWGVLTANFITRQDSFRTAIISAFAPFYNSALYGRKS